MYVKQGLNLIMDHLQSPCVICGTGFNLPLQIYREITIVLSPPILNVQKNQWTYLVMDIFGWRIRSIPSPLMCQLLYHLDWCYCEISPALLFGHICHLDIFVGESGLDIFVIAHIWW